MDYIYRSSSTPLRLSDPSLRSCWLLYNPAMCSGTLIELYNSVLCSDSPLHLYKPAVYFALTVSSTLQLYNPAL